MNGGFTTVVCIFKFKRSNAMLCFPEPDPDSNRSLIGCSTGTGVCEISISSLRREMLRP
jgi:hypothetical protein